MEGTIGEIRLFASTFAPRSWWYCDGTLLAIRSNTALFSILGNTYGGDGQTTFGLPNLKGRTAIGAGQGPGLSYYTLGETIGTNTVTLNNLNLAPHNHPATASISIPAYGDEGNSPSPSNNILAALSGMYSSDPPDTPLKPANYTLQVQVSGSNQPLSIMEPVLGMNYIICLTGVFPARG
ncbi:phage tail protein [Taibaiella lutea]|uniref:Phage tail protein n=1 Tax=Taibaiella lutea TaxID=2608001 RepID=A0A5M6CPZ4_9BACT|nr:tail fiber protein [Taibaiella lutea]KAA5536460.1 phage tail protein [Taibaiella lutea]